MAGKQLEKVLKSIERQLLKLVLSHAFNLATLSVRKSCIRNNSKKPLALGRQTFERGAVGKKKSIKKPSGQLHKHRNRGKKHGYIFKRF